MLERLQKLGPRASGHRAEHKHKREPTRDFSALLQRRQEAHHERQAGLRQSKTYIKEENDKPDMYRTMNTED